ncbi:MAG: sensor histidine kinase N-terminal domain-containing protein [Rhizobiaceae bacterium]|nr:sensor histidine kinase N-terminal domain-containing protein [Rhizobiaceae bacterium]
MTRRLMIWLTAAMVSFWLIAVIVGGLVMRDEFDEVFDSGLEETALRLMPLVVDDLYQRSSPRAAMRLSSSGQGDENLSYQVRDASGRILIHSHDAPTEPFAAPLAPGFWQAPDHRIFTVEALSSTLFLQVADPLENRREAMFEGMLSLLLPVLVLAPLSMVAIWYLVRRSLAPITVVRSQIGLRDGANLEPLGLSGIPAELQGIATSVDRLLERLRAAIDAEREFAANSAHELRTPVAGALAQVQRLIAELPDGTRMRRAEEVERSLEGLAHLTEKLLQLSRAESGIGLATRPTNVVAVVRMVAEEFSRRIGNADRIVLEMDASASPRRADVDALGIVLRNLIENALLHGAADEPIRVTCDGGGRISVSNAGPVVSPETLGRLTERFRRGGSPTPGSGLGLAIAAKLVAQMGGVLELHSPAIGRDDGFSAVISLE